MEREQLPEVTMLKPVGFEFSLLFLWFMWVGMLWVTIHTKKELLFTFKPAVVNPFPQSDYALFMRELV